MDSENVDSENVDSEIFGENVDSEIFEENVDLKKKIDSEKINSKTSEKIDSTNMELKNIKFDRKCFFNHCGNFKCMTPSPRLEPEMLCDYCEKYAVIGCDYRYIEKKDVKIFINDLALKLTPLIVYSHVHLCRILYAKIKVERENGDIIITCTDRGTAYEKIKKIIDLAKDCFIFEESSLEEYKKYFNNFSVD
jgi:hypothetical protein